MNGGRTFPSLVVVARPNLCTKDITAQIAQKERSELGIYLNPEIPIDRYIVFIAFIMLYKQADTRTFQITKSRAYSCFLRRSLLNG